MEHIMSLRNITILIFMIFSWSAAARNKIVNIGGQITELTSSTSCAPSNWNNKIDNACICCITKNYLDDKSPINNYITCVVEKKYCPVTLLDDMSRASGINHRTELAKFLSDVANKTMVAKDLTVPALHANLK
jgi:hypothetical protein